MSCQAESKNTSVLIHASICLYSFHFFSHKDYFDIQAILDDILVSYSNDLSEMPVVSNILI